MRPTSLCSTAHQVTATICDTVDRVEPSGDASYCDILFWTAFPMATAAPGLAVATASPGDP